MDTVQPRGELIILNGTRRQSGRDTFGGEKELVSQANEAIDVMLGFDLHDPKSTSHRRGN